ncbi:MAG TPA: ATP-binding protein [Thioploca sp.]|nr:MAG: AAA family ATPase [Beggiatoa sp. 4572_84]RKZ56792.1 MAG: AAA family ATPase [Gammaproteobacteria bacterium]HDN25582.1 ATP-binding protein [Thioploca sp.]
MTDLQDLIERGETLLAHIENHFPAPPAPPDWQNVPAFRWRKRNNQQGQFQPVPHPHRIRLQDLQGIDEQKQQIDRNTRQFLQKKPANNVLLWGTRGTGKSSLIKALLNEYAAQGLRLIEVEKHDLIDLPDIVEVFYNRPERFIIFCDDLSFEQNDASYRAIKSVLDSSISAPPDNVLIYATSNRRHLLPEYLRENLQAQTIDGEIHHGEAVEEKISLSERFGLWLSFYPFKQHEYLAIVRYWLQQFGMTNTDTKEIQHAALQWALKRGSRSGRSAWQFAKDWAGRTSVEHNGFAE